MIGRQILKGSAIIRYLNLEGNDHPILRQSLSERQRAVPSEGADVKNSLRAAQPAHAMPWYA